MAEVNTNRGGTVTERDHADLPNFFVVEVGSGGPPPIQRRGGGGRRATPNEAIDAIASLPDNRNAFVAIPIIVQEQDMTTEDPTGFTKAKGRLTSAISAAHKRGTIGFGTITRGYQANTPENQTDVHVMKVWRRPASNTAQVAGMASVRAA